MDLLNYYKSRFLYLLFSILFIIYEHVTILIVCPCIFIMTFIGFKLFGRDIITEAFPTVVVDLKLFIISSIILFILYFLVNQKHSEYLERLAFKHEIDSENHIEDWIKKSKRVKSKKRGKNCKTTVKYAFSSKLLILLISGIPLLISLGLIAIFTLLAFLGYYILIALTIFIIVSLLFGFFHIIYLFTILIFVMIYSPIADASELVEGEYNFTLEIYSTLKSKKKYKKKLKHMTQEEIDELGW